MPAQLYASNHAFLEHKIKLVFVFKFAEQIDGNWEKATSDRKIVIALYGEYDTDLITYLRNFERKPIKSIPVKLVFNPEEDVMKNSDIIFISNSYEGEFEPILKSVRAQTVTVSDKSYFVDKGGMIEFFNYRDKIRFAISNDNATASGIKFNAKLLELAARR